MAKSENGLSHVFGADEVRQMWRATPLWPFIEPVMDAWLAFWPSFAPSADQGGGPFAAFASAPWTPPANPFANTPFEPWFEMTPAGYFAAMMSSGSDGSGADRKGDAPLSSPQAARERAALNNPGRLRMVTEAPEKATPPEKKPLAEGGKLSAAKEQSGPASKSRKPRLRVVSDEKPSELSPKAATESAKLKATKVPAKRKTPPKPVTPDDLTAIKGVGPKLAAVLNDLGVKTYSAIAKMTRADLEALDEKLGAFRGRWERDDWVGQAKSLANAKK